MAPSTGRMLAGFLAFVAWSALVLLVVDLAANPLVAALCGLLFTVPLVSMWEWVTHGVLYHRALPGMARARKIHVGGHHLSLFPTTTYTRQGRYSFMRFRPPLTPWVMSETLLDTLVTSGAQTALHFVLGIPSILVPAWLLSHDPVFFGSCLATLSVLSVLLTYVHGVIHNPQGRLIERMGWFMWLDRHHYIHHVDMSANMNFLLPLCDLLVGTMKRELTPEEAAAHPSFEEAKPMAFDVRQAAPAR